MIHPDLSRSEQKVAEMCLSSLTQKVIAERLGLNLKTLKYHLTQIYKKTGCKSRLEFVFKFAIKPTETVTSGNADFDLPVGRK